MDWNVCVPRKCFDKEIGPETFLMDIAFDEENIEVAVKATDKVGNL